MNTTRFVCTCISLVFVSSGFALDEKYLSPSLKSFFYSLPPEPGSGFWERLEVALERNSVRLFESRFHPLRVNRRLSLSQGDFEEFRHRIDTVALGATTKFLTYSLREVAVESSVVYWLKDRQNSIAILLEDTLGDVEEEEVELRDINYRPVEQLWWKRVTEKRLQYGVRPLRTTPYAFFSFRVGNRSHPPLLFHTRYYLRDFFSTHRFELILSVRPIDGYSVDVGTRYDLERKSEPPILTLKFNKVFKSGSALFVGVGLLEHWSVSAGFVQPW